jgi:hypothetical protein
MPIESERWHAPGYKGTSVSRRASVGLNLGTDFVGFVAPVAPEKAKEIQRRVLEEIPERRGGSVVTAGVHRWTNELSSVAKSARERVYRTKGTAPRCEDA